MMAASEILIRVEEGGGGDVVLSSCLQGRTKC